MSGSKIAAMVRGAGMSADLVTKLIKAVTECGGTEEDVHYLVTPEGEPIIGMFAGHLVKMGATYRNRYPVKTKHSSLKAAIAAGGYDCFDSGITAENFKIAGEVDVDGELMLHYPACTIEYEAEKFELDQLGLRPATLQELCAFGATYPDIQRDFPVVALGSMHRRQFGDHDVPYLLRWDSRRRLGTSYWRGPWDPSCRFLAARK